jgi:hypothetical protein
MIDASSAPASQAARRLAPPGRPEPRRAPGQDAATVSTIGAPDRWPRAGDRTELPSPRKAGRQEAGHGEPPTRVNGPRKPRSWTSVTSRFAPPAAPVVVANAQPGFWLAAVPRYAVAGPGLLIGPDRPRQPGHDLRLQYQARRTGSETDRRMSLNDPPRSLDAVRTPTRGWVAWSTGQAAARWIGVPSTLRMTWMLPRVALE